MARSINDNPTYRAANVYRDFDLSQHLNFTSSVGQLLPIYYDVLNPGDKIKASQLLKTRTRPLASPAFTRLTEHVEWYFVPIQQIMSEFGSWYYGVQDFGTNFMGLASSPVVPSGTAKMDSRLPYMSSLFFRELYEYFWFDKTAQTPEGGERLYPQFVRLMEMLGVPAEVLLDEMPRLAGEQVKWSITPLLLCAYQKIFMDYYRVDNRVINEPDAYNLDAFMLDGKADLAAVSPSYFAKMIALRYRPLLKDFYTNVYPSPVFGDQSVGATQFYNNHLDSTLNAVNQWLSNVSRVVALDREGYDYPLDPTQIGLGSVTEVADRAMLTRANIETVYAADKLLEITRRAGKHYDAQTLAHFGVKVPDYIEGQAIKLGHHSQDIIIGDVVATSNTQNGSLGSPLGELAGKGYSADRSKPVNFTAPCHGVLMAIYSCVPIVDYYQYGLDKLNALIERGDWFTPEYDSLGMQPLFEYQSRLTYDNSAVANAAVRGWQYRYSELKQKYNRIVGGFKSSALHWTVGRNSRYTAGDNVRNYYASPWALDNIVEFLYSGGADTSSPTGDNVVSAVDLYERDPLDHDVQFDVTKVSKMSRYGLLDL